MTALKTFLLIFLLIPAISAAERQSIRIGIDLWPGYYPAILAKILGYFDREGIDVDIVLPEDTDDMLNDFTSGKLDLVCVAMGDAFTLKAKDEGLRVILVTDESAGGDALLAQKGSSSKIKGKRIGTNLNGFGELFIQAFLEQNNLTINDVQLVHQEASQAIPFLRENKADIVHTWEPYVTEAVAFNYGDILFDSSKTPGLIPDAILANSQSIHEKRTQLKSFTRAWFKAVEWWQQNRKKGDSIIESELLLMPGTIDLKNIRLYTQEDNHRAFDSAKSDASIYPTAQLYIDFFQSKGVIKKGLKVDDFLTDQFLHK